MDREVGRQYRLTGAHQGGRGPSGGVVSEGGDHSGVDISVLLAEAGENRHFGLQPVRADTDQSDSKVSDERRIGQHLFDLRLRLARGSSSRRFPILDRSILSERFLARNPNTEWGPSALER